MHLTLSLTALVLQLGLGAGLALAAPGAPKTATPAPPLDPGKIYVDNYCRIRATGLGTNTPATRAFTDRGICSVGAEQYSERWETSIVAGKRKSAIVQVGEHTFSLHNPTSRPIEFVVKHQLGKRWQVDSDPAPQAVTGRVATFVISALPGQTVELHVGEHSPLPH